MNKENQNQYSLIIFICKLFGLFLQLFKRKDVIENAFLDRYWTIYYDNGDVCRYKRVYRVRRFNDGSIKYNVHYSDYPNIHFINKAIITFKERYQIRNAIREIKNENKKDSEV